jgi:nucleoside 2-deoxyribosyltransferase
MKTIYFAYAMTHGTDSLNEVNELIEWLRDKRIRVCAPAYSLFPDVLAAGALKAMDEADLVIADVSSRSHGVGFEVGYAFANRKPVILIAKASARAHVSKFLLGLFPQIVFYPNSHELVQSVAGLLAELGRRPRRAATGEPRHTRKFEMVAAR